MKNKKDRERLILELEKKATELRIMMIKMLEESGASAHWGGSMSVMDILTVLYFRILRVDPSNPHWEDRDRLVLSKGHACAALCPVLAEKGFFSTTLLSSFNKLDSPFGMHPDMRKIPGCDMSTGSLGHGGPVAVGMALAGKYLKKNYRVYIVLSDGELAEGSTWEAIEIASHFKLDNLCGIIDRNKFSLDGPTEGPGIPTENQGILGTMTLEPIGEKLKTFGWHVIECDGHDFDQLLDSYEEATRIKGKPTMIIAYTIKGKGISFIENRYDWHYGQFTSEQYKIAMEELTCRLKEIEKKLEKLK